MGSSVGTSPSISGYDMAFGASATSELGLTTSWWVDLIEASHGTKGLEPFLGHCIGNLIEAYEVGSGHILPEFVLVLWALLEALHDHRLNLKLPSIIKLLSLNPGVTFDIKLSLRCTHLSLQLSNLSLSYG